MTNASSRPQINRISGGLVDQTRTLKFSFNGKTYTGHPGDTLASALLANGVRLVGRSFKYHRPRGIFSSGSEEPNALVELHKDAHREPNTRATTTELFQGLSAASQNHIGPLAFDVLAVNDILSPFLSAGFYYKTFMWPRSFWEKLYEPAIRAAAGLGRLSGEPDPDTYDKGFLHCDLLIIGAGPAGLSAALSAGRTGARVILADEDFRMGGRLLAESCQVNATDGATWVETAIDELASMTNVRLMPRTTIFGAYDHGIYGALERETDNLPAGGSKPRQVLWRVYSKRAMLCAGSTERSIAFGNNDRPGIMLAGSVRAYVNRWGATPGRRVAVFTNNDNGWQTATDLAAKGVEITAIIDSRNGPPRSAPGGTPVVMGEKIVDTKGRLGITSIKLASGQTFDADCLAVSGGWSPNVHLTCHQRSKPEWRNDIAAFVPGSSLPVGMVVAGAANGAMTTGAAIKQAHQSAAEISKQLGYNSGSGTAPNAPTAQDEASDTSAFWHVKESKARAWIDLQNDVTSKDIKQSHQEGFRSVEHLKRYTTLGMATDQGKTANILGLAVLAECSGKTIAQTGTTMFRPPYTPVSIGVLAGRARGKNFRPTRLTPSHQWATKQGAQFVEAGNWLRAQWFPKPDERHWRESVDREVRQTRASVGVCDVTSLGKIDIQGRDAATFINRAYANGFAKLPIGKVRYGLMLREDGIVMDDGTTAHLAENHYLMTTTTANAVSVYRHLEFCRQCLWPDLDVHLISVTEQYAQYAIAGPNSRALLEKIVDPEFDISNSAFPFMACGNITVCGGTPARLFRISFSGELAYELAVPARHGEALIKTLLEAGNEFEAVPYGVEALGVMRIEKGHPAGNELDGRTTARNLGMASMVSKKTDFIGNVLSKRQALNADEIVELVGLQPVNREHALAAGAHLIAKGNPADLENDQGWLSSAAYSPTLAHAIALGFIKHGRQRMGQTVRAVDLLRGTDIEVEIVSPHFVDPDGGRLRG